MMMMMIPSAPCEALQRGEIQFECRRGPREYDSPCQGRRPAENQPLPLTARRLLRERGATRMRACGGARPAAAAARPAAGPGASGTAPCKMRAPPFSNPFIPLLNVTPRGTLHFTANAGPRPRSVMLCNGSTAPACPGSRGLLCSLQRGSICM